MGGLRCFLLATSISLEQSEAAEILISPSKSEVMALKNVWNNHSRLKVLPQVEALYTSRSSSGEKKKKSQGEPEVYPFMNNTKHI